MPAGTGSLYHIVRKRSGRISYMRSRYIVFCGAKYIVKRGMLMRNETILELSIELTITITNLCDSIQGRSIFKNQLLRACSSVGANASEAKYAQSRADFINKMEIALKECHETEYWLTILYRIRSLTEEQFTELSKTCGTIRRKLIASITTAKKGIDGDESISN